VVWVFSELLALRQNQTRREQMARAIQLLAELNAKLSAPRARQRLRREVQADIDEIVRRNHVVKYLDVSLSRETTYTFKQTRPGRPGRNTRYVRKAKYRWQINWKVNDDAIAYDLKSDGMYPLLTNDAELTAQQVLHAHKRQPTIEKRFEQTKTVFEIAPVLLKNVDRIEALFFVYFLSLLVQSLIERELRRAMADQGIHDLPLYPEQRRTKRPTAEQVFRLFTHVQRHILLYDGEPVRRFQPQLTDLQAQVLRLLGVPRSAYLSA
jgi:transposase